MRFRPLLLVILAGALAGCGDRRLLLGVDALSFTSPQDRVDPFGPVPALVVPVQTGEVPVLDDLHVNLFGGADQIVNVDQATLTLSANLADSTGSGLDTLRVYMSDVSTDPRTTAPVVIAPVVLTPGQSTSIHAVVGGDPRVTSLFTNSQMRVTVTTSLQGPAVGQPLNGVITLTTLRADVVASRRNM